MPLGTASNPMLAQAEEGIAAKMPANLSDSFSKVIHAGLTIIYSPKLSDQRNARIAATHDPVKEAADGAARLVSNLYQQSGKKLPIPLVVPAAIIFGFEWLDLLAKAGKAQITPDLIAQTTQAVADAVLPLMGITKDKLAQLMAKAQAGGAQTGVDPQTPAPPAGIIAGAQGGA